MADVHFGVRALQTLLGDWREQRGTRPAYLALADRIRLLSIDGRLGSRPVETTENDA